MVVIGVPFDGVLVQPHVVVRVASGRGATCNDMTGEEIPGLAAGVAVARVDVDAGALGDFIQRRRRVICVGVLVHFSVHFLDIIHFIVGRLTRAA